MRPEPSDGKVKIVTTHLPRNETTTAYFRRDQYPIVTRILRHERFRIELPDPMFPQLELESYIPVDLIKHVVYRAVQDESGENWIWQVVGYRFESVVSYGRVAAIAHPLVSAASIGTGTVRQRPVAPAPVSEPEQSASLTSIPSPSMLRAFEILSTASTDGHLSRRRSETGLSRYSFGSNLAPIAEVSTPSDTSRGVSPAISTLNHASDSPRSMSSVHSPLNRPSSAELSERPCREELIYHRTL